MNTNFTLDSAYDGLHLSVLMVRPEGEPSAVLQLSHGMCGCKERYLPFMEYMSDHGVACVASDHRGHGASVLSKDDLGYMYSGGYVALVEDMKMVSDWTRKRFPDVPLFLLGHSMVVHLNGLDLAVAQFPPLPSWEYGIEGKRSKAFTFEIHDLIVYRFHHQLNLMILSFRDGNDALALVGKRDMAGLCQISADVHAGFQRGDVCIRQGKFDTKGVGFGHVTLGG